MRTADASLSLLSTWYGLGLIPVLLSLEISLIKIIIIVHFNLASLVLIMGRRIAFQNALLCTYIVCGLRLEKK